MANSKVLLTANHWGLTTVVSEPGQPIVTASYEGDARPSVINQSVVEGLTSEFRIRRPAIRKGWLEGDTSNRGQSDFVDCSWDDALDLIENRLRRTIDRFSNTGIFGGSYGWGSAGRFHHSQSQLKRFLNTIGGFVDQKQTYSFAAGQIICPHVVGDNRIMFGGETTSWNAICKNARLIVFFGGINLHNSQIASGGLVSHQTFDWLKAVHDAGIRVISIGPRRDRIAGLPDLEWLPIRPGTDVALMLAIASELYDAGRADRSFLSKYTVGSEWLEAYISGQTDGVKKTTGWASSICDVPVDAIKDLAQSLAETPSFLSASWSLQRQHHGEQPLWMLIALASILGEIGQPGRGVSFGEGSIGNRGIPKPKVVSPRLPVGTNPTDLFIPVSRFADMMLNPGKTIPFDGTKITYPEIDFVWWTGGNPFHHHQDINNLRLAFKVPSTVVVTDLWWTATAKHADIVLPAVSSFERNDISAAPTCDHIVASKSQMDPIGEARSEYAIFSELARRFGTQEIFTEGRSEMEWLQHIFDTFRAQPRMKDAGVPDFNTFWTEGFLKLRPDNVERTLFEDFRADPTKFPLATPSGRIELYSKRIESFGLKDFAPHPAWREPAFWLGNAKHDELHLISPQPKNRLHSQFDKGGESAKCKIGGHEPIYLNANDAVERNLSDGDVVEVSNDLGRCLAGVITSNDVRKGVAILATGAWYAPDEDGCDTGGNPNVLTSDLITSELSQGPAQHTALVLVRKLDTN